MSKVLILAFGYSALASCVALPPASLQSYANKSDDIAMDGEYEEIAGANFFLLFSHCTHCCVKRGCIPSLFFFFNARYDGLHARPISESEAI